MMSDRLHGGARDLLPGALAVAGLFLAVTLATLLLGPNMMVMALFPVPVAVAMATGRRWRALALAGAAAASGLAALQSVELAVVYALVAGTGLVMGLCLARGWPYGRVVAVVTALAFGLVALQPLLAWDEWVQLGVAAMESMERSLSAASDQVTPEQLAVPRWLKGHWADLGLGGYFATTLLVVCLGVSVTAWWLRLDRSRPRPHGSFSTMRPPDWAVWLVILVAGLWYADQRWPHAALRLTSWNGAVALAAVYWLNGLSVLGYVVGVLRPGPLLVLVLVLGLMVPPVHQVVAVAGLFDTWVDFRKRADAVAAARRDASKPDSHDDGGP